MAKKDETLSLARLEKLKGEIEALKSKKNSKDEKKATPANVMHTMEELSETLTQFMETFQEATEEMRLEEKEEDFFARELKPLHDKLNMVLDQNEKIAKGIIAVANMLNTDIPFIKRMVAGASMGPPSTTFEAPKPQFGSMPPPVPPMPKPMAPMSPGGGQKLTGAPMPPPPRPPEKKKSRFTELFK